MYHFATPTEETAYRTAILNHNRPFNTVEGTLTFTDPTKTPLTINSSNLPTDAIKISSQCIDSEELMFGGVFSSELDITLLTQGTVDRYAYFGATVELNFKIHIGTENDEPIFSTVPLGVFTVADADRPTNQIHLVAYDNLTLLDTSIGANVLTGNAWTIFGLVSYFTGIELAFEETDLEDFPNKIVQIEVSQDRGINTYRDVVKTVCQMLGCFAYADRTGKLAVKQFSTTADITLGNNTTGVYPWYTFVPADYQSNYIGLSVTSTSGTYQATTSDPSEQGLVMTIEDAPAWDIGSEESLLARTEELFTVLHDIEYTPSELDMPSDATLECGDMIALNVRNYENPIYTIITSYTWEFHKGMTITSEGANPRTKEEFVDSTGQRILNQAVAKSKLQFVHFTNPSAVNVGDNQTVEIAEVEFTPTAETDALFVATILVDATVADVTKTTTETVQVPITVKDSQGQPAVITDLQGNPLTVTGSATNTYTYKRDGKCETKIFYKIVVDQSEHIVPNANNPYYAIEDIENGQHIITVVYPITGLTPWVRYGWKICMTLDGGSLVIPAKSIKASIFGQEVNILSRFDGTIKASDEYPLMVLGKEGMLTVYDSGEVSIQTATYASVSDNISLYNISDMDIIPFYEGTGELLPHIFFEGGAKITTDSGDYIVTDDGKRIITD